MFDTINEYFSNEFQNQLIINNQNLWATSEIKQFPIHSSLFLNDKGNILAINLIFWFRLCKFFR